MLEALQVEANRVLERFGHELLARLEVVGRRGQRDACFGGDRAMGERADSLTADERDGGLEDGPAARLSTRPPRAGRAQCPPAALSPATPAMMRTRLTSLSGVMLSPKASIPINAIAAVPRPAQTA